MTSNNSKIHYELENLQHINDVIDENLNKSTNLEEIELNLNKSDTKVEVDIRSGQILNKSDTKIEMRGGQTETDGRNNTNFYTTKRNVAEGMMDIALLTANANQLRFLITYNYDAKTFYVNMILIILSLVIQVAVGIALIFKRQMKNRGNLNKANRTNDFLVVGIFLVTIINVFVAAFTTTDSITN